MKMIIETKQVVHEDRQYYVELTNEELSELFYQVQASEGSSYGINGTIADKESLIGHYIAIHIDRYILLQGIIKKAGE